MKIIKKLCFDGSYSICRLSPTALIRGMYRLASICVAAATAAAVPDAVLTQRVSVTKHSSCAASQLSSWHHQCSFVASPTV